MGKTKTAFVSGAPEEAKSGQEKYKERQKKKAQKEKETQKVHLPGLKGGQRIVAISAESPPEKVEKELIATKKIKTKKKKIKARSKKYLSAQAKVDKNSFYPLEKAIELIKEVSYSNFEGMVELHLVVNKANLQLNVELPHSSGKKKKIEIADEATIAKLKQGQIDYDLLLATPEMMPQLIPYAKLLGPKGLMPNPKDKTLIKSAKDAQKFSSTSATIKGEKNAPLVHVVVGKISLSNVYLKENIEAIFKAIGPRQIKRAFLKATMSPSVKVKIS